jgi:hypothetical protein
MCSPEQSEKYGAYRKAYRNRVYRKHIGSIQDRYRIAYRKIENNQVAMQRKNPVKDGMLVENISMTGR